MIILKNKIKVVMIFVFSAVILTLGISVAYYNTCSLAFDPLSCSAPSQKKVSLVDSVPVSSPAATVNGFAVDPGS